MIEFRTSDKSREGSEATFPHVRGRATLCGGGLMPPNYFFFISIIGTFKKKFKYHMPTVPPKIIISPY